MTRPKVILGSLPPLLREGLSIICGGQLDLCVSTAAANQLVGTARERDAVAIIVDPVDIEALRRDLPLDPLLIGLPQSIETMIVCWGGEHVEFVVARRLPDLVRSWARSLPRPALASAGRE